ncbi:hypothetical protein BU23DRAFT_544047, partial [Bimuria novae-zelandiae CBS 107.79]
QNVVITGAGIGIGAAIAHRLAAEGANLVLFARTESKLNDFAQQIREKSNPSQTTPPFALDVSSAVSTADILTIAATNVNGYLHDRARGAAVPVGERVLCVQAVSGGVYGCAARRAKLY